MISAIANLLEGKGSNYIMPFFWQHGEEEKVLREYMGAMDMLGGKKPRQFTADTILSATAIRVDQEGKEIDLKEESDLNSNQSKMHARQKSKIMEEKEA